MVFGPVVEVPHEGAFLAEEPYVLLQKGQLQHLPLLVSIEKDEGLFLFSQRNYLTQFVLHTLFKHSLSLIFYWTFLGILYEEKYLKQLDEEWLSLAPDLLGYSYSVSSETERDKISSAIREYYFGNKSISNETMTQLMQVC